MNPTSADLLRMLSPVSPGAPAPQSAPPSEGAAFASLLQKAQAGKIASGRPVTIRPEANLKLSDDQLDRVALAADRAEAQGAARAAVLIDGKVLTLDVANREIVGQSDFTDLSVSTGIDAVVAAPAPASSASATPTPAPLPAPGYANPSLLQLLARSMGVNQG